MTPSSRVYVAPPVACATTEQIAAQGHGEFTLGRASHRAVYDLPTHASNELREFFRLNAVADFSGEYLARLPNGRVFGAGNVFSADGRLIARDVSPDFGKNFNEHWLLSYQKMPPPVTVAGTTAVVATTLGYGYGHWLLEELPRWLRLNLAECEAVIAHHASPFAKQAMAWLGFTGRLIEPVRNSHFSCDQLLVPSFLGEPGYPSAEVNALLTTFFASRGTVPSGRGERLYLSRAQSRRRRVRNEDKLWALLETRGFVRVYLEELDLASQLAAFRAAKVIVSPHGAGLANLVFCEPGSRVIELFNRAYVNGVYWRLAALKELDYRPLVPAGGEPLGNASAANRHDIDADLAQVLAAIAE